MKVLISTDTSAVLSYEVFEKNNLSANLITIVV